MKTFIILASLAGMAAMSQAATIFETSHSGTTLNRGNYYGIRFQLNDTRWLTTTPSESTLPATVYLTDLSIQKRDTSSNDSSYTAGAFKIALTDSTGALISFSDNSLTYTDISYSAMMEFTFSSTPELSSNAIYNFYYVKAEATADDFLANRVQIGTRVGQGPNAPTGQGMLNAAGNIQDAGWGGIFKVTTTDTLPIPEPATATLGLLGLAGLMVRRRRS